MEFFQPSKLLPEIETSFEVETPRLKMNRCKVATTEGPAYSFKVWLVEQSID